MKLLDEGKLVRYLTYAVGEVVLIIVGIFFALQLNNINEDRKAQAEFDLYIVQLKEDVRAAIAESERVSENNRNLAKECFNLQRNGICLEDANPNG